MTRFDLHLKLTFSRRNWECDSRWANGCSRLERGMVPLLGCTQVSTTLGIL